MEAKTASKAAPDSRHGRRSSGVAIAQVSWMAAFSTRTGIVVAPRGQLVVAFTLTFGEDRISGYTVVANPARLGWLWIALLDYPFGR